MNGSHAVQTRKGGYACSLAAVLIAATLGCRDDGPRPPVPVGIMWGSGATGAMVEDTVSLVAYYHDINGQPIGWNDPPVSWSSSNPAVLEIISESTAVARDTGRVELGAVVTEPLADTFVVSFDVVPRWRGRMVWARSPTEGANPGIALLELPAHEVRQLPDLGYPGSGSGDPYLTSDGRLLAASASRPNSPLSRLTIYVVDLVTGTKTAPLASMPSNQFHSVWFPDDTLLAFLSDAAGAYEVFTARPDGTDIQQRTQLGQSRPPSFAVTPDGHLVIALQISGAQVDLYETSLSGTVLRRITNTPEEELLPAVSPDGTRLAYKVGSQAWVSDRDGSNSRRLLPERFVPLGYDAFPASAASGPPSWTPDSRFVLLSWDVDAFVNAQTGYYFALGEVYAIRVADGLAIRLTRWPRVDGSPFFR